MFRRTVVLAAGLMLAACATTTPPKPAPKPTPAPAPAPKPEPKPAPAPEPPAPPPGIAFADLPGWDSEDHAAALDAYRAGCGADKDPVGQEVCRRAKAAGPLDEVASRYFLETHFRATPVGEPGQ